MTSPMSSEMTPKLSEDPLSPTSVFLPAEQGDGSPHNHQLPSVVNNHHIHADGEEEEDEETVEVRSQTAVTMVSSASSSSLLPSAAMSSTVGSGSPGTVIIAKPFFVMDWLEEVNPRDLELARQMLQTPNKKNNNGGRNHSSTPALQGRDHSSDVSSQRFHPGGGNRSYPPRPANKSSPSLSTSMSDSTTAPLSSKPERLPDSSRDSIALPTLLTDEHHPESHAVDAMCSRQKDDSVCRQLYTATETASASSSSSETGSTPSSARGSGILSSYASSGNLSTSTSVTSTSSSMGSRDHNNHAQQTSSSSSSATGEETKQEEPLVPEIMSPFKKRSIAIGNGWNAKGLHKAKKGSWESALLCWENALEIRTQVLGETHPDVANTCNNIGIALGKLGRYDAAIEVLERALEQRAKHYGTREHVEIAATLHNIGNVLHAAQDCAGAIQCFWDAKLLQQQLLGPDHVQVARACVATGNVYYEATQYEDAREAYCDALSVFANAGLDKTHPEVMAIQEDLNDIEMICAQQQQEQVNIQFHYYNAHQMHYHQQQQHLRYHQQYQLHQRQDEHLQGV